MASKFAPVEKLDVEGYRLLTVKELCERIEEPDTRSAARVEICRRLRNRPDRATYLAFRWLCALNDDDKADAFDGLRACCWNSTEKRIYPYGLYPEGLLEGREAIVREMRDAIATVLVDRLHQMASLSPNEIAETALRGGLQLDVDVANTVRRDMRHKPETHSLDDVLTGSDQQEEEAPTLLELLPVDPETGANRFNEAAELIASNQAKIKEVLGERGWEVLLEFLKLEDNHSLPEGEREREASLTRVFEKVYRVAERQARNHKARFRSCFQAAVEAGHPVIGKIAELLGWQWRTRSQKSDS